jgi:polyhydroxyalkanoate synthase
VAPWRSVYKWNQLADTNVTFVLTQGGHNTGIVSEPGHPRRSYQIATRIEGDIHIDAETWSTRTTPRRGSWWPEWTSWLHGRSGEMTRPPGLGAADKGYSIQYDAPGTYVQQR